MTHAEHMTSSTLALGTSAVLHDKVHKHLDAYWPMYGDAHRMIFHHAQGIEHMREHYGDVGAAIAEQHIRDDYNGELPEGYMDSTYFPARMDVFYQDALAVAEGIYG